MEENDIAMLYALQPKKPGKPVTCRSLRLINALIA